MPRYVYLHIYLYTFIVVDIDFLGAVPATVEAVQPLPHHPLTNPEGGLVPPKGSRPSRREEILGQNDHRRPKEGREVEMSADEEIPLVAAGGLGGGDQVRVAGPAALCASKGIELKNLLRILCSHNLEALVCHRRRLH